MKRLFTSLIPLLILLLTSNAICQTLQGKVVNVADGDTITILDGSKTQHKIRLYGIDTPERGQAFGNVAQEFTSNLTAGKIVDVIPYDTDKYGRTVGVVLVNGQNVNQQLISAGYAWQYGKYCKESFCNDWSNLEQEARDTKRGLWTEAAPTAPWDYRTGKTASYTSRDSQDTLLTAAGGSYHGNVNSHVFHESSCRYYNCKNCVQNFASQDEAINAGYRPCKICRP